MEQYIIPIVGTIILSLGTFIMNHLYHRIEVLEQQQKEMPTKQEVRDMLNDKIDPVKEDIADIKQALNKVFDILTKK